MPSKPKRRKPTAKKPKTQPAKRKHPAECDHDLGWFMLEECKVCVECGTVTHLTMSDFEEMKEW